MSPSLNTVSASKVGERCRSRDKTTCSATSLTLPCAPARGRPAAPARRQGPTGPWLDLLRDLAWPQAVTLDLDGTRDRLRTDCAGHAAKAFQAPGVAIPTLGSPPSDRPRRKDAQRRPRRRSPEH